ncbi:MAG: hypothetical protein WC280_01215 [Patescibacteria group bacterium]
MDNKEKKDDISLDENELFNDSEVRKMRTSNKINSFLNSNFQFVSILLIIAVFWFSFVYILSPKYDRIIKESTEILKENKENFVREYRVLADNRESINTFNQIKEEDVDKIMKIVPESYSRDSLFTWFTYFLMKNNYNVRSVKIIDINEVNKTQQTDQTARRGVGEVTAEQGVATTSLSYSPNHFNSLPYDVSSRLGAWVINVQISGVTYPDLRYLVDIIEKNLKIIDVISLDFNPGARVVEIEALSYYKK